MTIDHKRRDGGSRCRRSIPEAAPADESKLSAGGVVVDRRTSGLRVSMLLAVLSCSLLASCAPRHREERLSDGFGDERLKAAPEKIVLAAQYGLAYAPVAVARSKGWFAEELPGTLFAWETTGNASMVRDAILSGRMDGGFMGIPPYLIAKDKGMEWTAVAAVAEAELGLTTVRPDVRSLEDIPPDLRIALPQPGSIQHILLTMAADRRFGDAGRFDNQLVTLKHPDGMAALLSGTEVEAHFTSPPYLQQELATGEAHLVTNGRDAFGGRFTFIIAVVSDELLRNYPEAVEGLRRTLARASGWISENPAKAADLLADLYPMEREEILDLLESGALRYGGEVLGMEKFRDFMYAEGYLRTDLESHVLVVP